MEERVKFLEERDKFLETEIGQLKATIANQSITIQQQSITIQQQSMTIGQLLKTIEKLVKTTEELRTDVQVLKEEVVRQMTTTNYIRAGYNISTTHYRRHELLLLEEAAIEISKVIREKLQEDIFQQNDTLDNDRVPVKLCEVVNASDPRITVAWNNLKQKIGWTNDMDQICKLLDDNQELSSWPRGKYDLLKLDIADNSFIEWLSLEKKITCASEIPRVMKNLKQL